MTIPIVDLSRRTLEFFQNWKDISDDPENYNLCVARERWQEIEFGLSRGDDGVLFWDGASLRGVDWHVAKLSLDNLYFPRCGAPTYRDNTLFSIFSALGGVPCVSSEDAFRRAEYWPFYVPERYLKRDVIVVPKIAVSEVLKRWSDTPFFLKTLHKGWSFAGTADEFYQGGMAYSLDTGSADEPMIISDHMEIREDKHGKMEYRVFYVNGRISMSRYKDYESIPVEREARLFASTIHEHLIRTNVLPRNTVVDICLTKAGPRIVEVNDLCSSGRYVDNTVEKVFGGNLA
jgi:hypothetical protein